MQSGFVTDIPRVLLKLEGVALLCVACALYQQFGYSWKIFALLFFVPDLAIAAYAINSRMGAVFYNAAHSTVGPFALLAAGILNDAPVMLQGGYIWLAHVGFDRALGYGLKYSTSFRDTHLGQIGRNS